MRAKHGASGDDG
jgi:vacuolar-type H+-ATPase catalytic subunit A/Vma1